ncbi:NAD(P)-dependent oxidoreductase [Candidatus Halobonum tyrrellensis]|uniref:NAD-dependent epimerase/dehydratase n=1 Tax=Candidatus Halobonum tyrrellensis G22 TaxID=1324957 RepID=V4HJZ4_9EURY|nr:NAD(P)H-binding protein [Candidatus Halobonum tyrrellensis]ESP90098.1 NAD-dependent epimerase/dehydratase [Candidatus Halobonum tyrrellensis G22]
MDVLLLGASGRIGHRIAAELLDRGHSVTGVSRGGTVDGVDHPEFVAVAGDATDPDAVARLAAGHDAVASALGPSEDEDTAVLVEMARAVTEGMAAAGVDRLVWTGGAGGLNVGPDTLLVDTDEFPDEWEPVARAAIDALGVLRETDLAWTYVAPAAMIEPGDRTGEYRTAEGELVADDDGESYVSMEDFAVAFVDELEDADAVHTRLGVGY